MSLSIVFFLSTFFSSCMWAIAFLQQQRTSSALRKHELAHSGMRNHIDQLWKALVEQQSRTKNPTKIVRNPALNKSSKNTRGAKKDGQHSATLPHKNGNQNSARKSKKVDSKKRGK